MNYATESDEDTAEVDGKRKSAVQRRRVRVMGTLNRARPKSEVESTMLLPVTSPESPLSVFLVRRIERYDDQRAVFKTPRSPVLDVVEIATKGDCKR